MLINELDHPSFIMSNLPRNELSSELFSELFSASERDAVLRLTRRFGRRDEVLEALLHSKWKSDVAERALEAANEIGDADGFKLTPSTTTSRSPEAHMTEAERTAAKADLGYIILKTPPGYEHHRDIHRKNWTMVWKAFGLPPPPSVPKGWSLRHCLTEEGNQKLWSNAKLKGSPPQHDP